ncbi:MAG TPA: sigma-70 family RNA polymerase sigma factor [Chitinophagaceae bacterium]|nr:sigma-70 family RNA polymerase sigma factor [Chitinophagaceae bacterium]
MNYNTGNNFTDRQLVERVLGGDNPAFALIIKNTERIVAQIVFKMISNPEDRKDIAQDIYLKAFKKLGSFRFESKLSTWIAQISYNACMDYLRKKKLILAGNIFEENENGIDMPGITNIRSSGDPGTEINDFILKKELSAILKTEIEKLSLVYKTLISLYHNEELSYEEIGQITGLPAGTVKSYLFRARKTLKDNLLLSYKKEDL